MLLRSFVATLVALAVVLPSTYERASAQTPGQHDDADRAPFLSDYAGQYELTPTFILTVTRVGDALYVQGPGQSASQMRPRSETEFVLVGGSLRIIFGIDPVSGEVDHLIFEQSGVGRRAAKLDGPTAVTDARQVVDLSPGTLERYVGTYEEQPGFAITISLEDGQLAAGMEGRPTQTMLPESETDFFYEDSKASLSFELGSDGEVERLILHQGGSDLPMDRVRD